MQTIKDVIWYILGNIAWLILFAPIFSNVMPRWLARVRYYLFFEYNTTCSYLKKQLILANLSIKEIKKLNCILCKNQNVVIFSERGELVETDKVIISALRKLYGKSLIYRAIQLDGGVSEVYSFRDGVFNKK